MTYNVFSGTLNPTHFTSLHFTWPRNIGALGLQFPSHNFSCQLLYKDLKQVSHTIAFVTKQLIWYQQKVLVTKSRQKREQLPFL